MNSRAEYVKLANIALRQTVALLRAARAERFVPSVEEGPTDYALEKAENDTLCAIERLT